MSEKLSQLIDSKKQLLLNLSHEIKTPITRTKLSLELLDKNKHTLSIQEDIKDIELIIDSILGAERIASQNCSAKTESIYLEPVIQKIVHSHSVLTSYKIQKQSLKIKFFLKLSSKKKYPNFSKKAIIL